MSGRIRTIKPEWLEDEKLAALSDEARLLSVALLLLADDHGRGRASPLYLASRVWCYGDASETLAKVSRGLRELAAAGYATFYKVKGQQYFAIRNWTKHQRVDKPSKPRVPGPEQRDDGDGSPPDSGEPREVPAPDPDLRSGSPTATVAREEPPEDRDEHPLRLLRTTWSQAFETATAKFWATTKARNAALLVMCTWLVAMAERAGCSYDEAVSRWVASTIAHPDVASRDHSLEFAASQPEKYWPDAPRSAGERQSANRMWENRG